MASVIKIWDEAQEKYISVPTLRGEKGDPFTYNDFTAQQLKDLTGPIGPVGPIGKSAYDYYVENGGTLTEEEWMMALEPDVDDTLTMPGKAADAKIVGDKLSEICPITVDIIPSKSTVFVNKTDYTILTAHVYKNGIELEVTEYGRCGEDGYINWYDGDSTTCLFTGKSIRVLGSDINSSRVYTAKLEDSPVYYKYLYGYDLVLSDENPDTRVSYPSDVMNMNYVAAGLDSNNEFKYGDWTSIPGNEFMPRPCMLTYTGKVAEYLNENDYTKTVSGEDSNVSNIDFGGNAMMEWPKIYVHREEIDGVYKFRCSNVKMGEDWDCWSNYDKNNNVIEHFYTPIYFGSNVNSKLRSISGQTNSVNTNGTTEITLATSNGDGWYTEVISDRFLIQDLLVMMSKSTNGQKKFGRGVTTASEEIGQGTMNDKGLFYGTYTNGNTGVKIFGMENWYGNIWRRQAGWIIVNGEQRLKLTQGTKDGSIATNYNTTGEGYIVIPDSTPSGTSGGYIKSMKTTPFGRVPHIISGSSTTNEADGTWFNNTLIAYVLVGGRWGHSWLVGPFYVHLNARVGDSRAYIGSSLSCKPLAK